MLNLTREMTSRNRRVHDTCDWIGQHPNEILFSFCKEVGIRSKRNVSSAISSLKSAATSWGVLRFGRIGDFSLPVKLSTRRWSALVSPPHSNTLLLLNVLFSILRNWENSLNSQGRPEAVFFSTISQTYVVSSSKCVCFAREPGCRRAQDSNLFSQWRMLVNDTQ